MAATALKIKTAAQDVFEKVGFTPMDNSAFQIPVAFLEAIKVSEKSLGKDKGSRDVVMLSLPLERFLECFGEMEEAVEIPKENTIVAKRTATKKGAKAAAAKSGGAKEKSPKAKSPKAIEEVLSEAQLEELKAKGTKPGAHLKKLADVLTGMGIAEEKHKAAREQWSAWAKSNDVPTVKAAKEVAELLSEEQLEGLKAKGYHNASQVRSMEDDLVELGIAKENHKAARDQWVKWAKDNGVPSRKDSPKASPKEKKETTVAASASASASAAAVPETPKKKVVKKAVTPAAPKKEEAAKPVEMEEEDDEVDVEELASGLEDLLDEE